MSRPNSLTRIKNYNLRNQGWPAEFSCYPNEVGNGPPLIRDPVFHTKQAIGVFPSNSDIVYFAKSTIAEDSPNVGGYSPWFLRKNYFGNTPAPKGHFILNAFNRNRQAVTGISGTYNEARDRDSTRAVSVTFFAGRIFYLKPNGQVLFSQVLSDINRAENCYQEADPTAEDINDLVATDGGVINIRDIGEGFKLVNTSDRVYVFADNGVWYISGPLDSGFSATDFQVRKLTEAGCVGPNSVVVADSVVFFWADSGIYVIAADPSTGQPVAQNLSEQSIQTFYNNITSAGKSTCQAFYDTDDRKIYWAYNNDSDFNGVNWRYKYNRVLIFDIVLGAFYLYDFADEFTVNESNPNTNRSVSQGFVESVSVTSYQATVQQGTPATSQTWTVTVTIADTSTDPQWAARSGVNGNCSGFRAFGGSSNYSSSNNYGSASPTDTDWGTDWMPATFVGFYQPNTYFDRTYVEFAPDDQDATENMPIANGGFNLTEIEFPDATVYTNLSFNSTDPSTISGVGANPNDRGADLDGTPDDTIFQINDTSLGNRRLADYVGQNIILRFNINP